MWYGLTKRDFIKGLLFFAELGIFAAAAGLIGVAVSRPESKNYGALLYLMIGLPGIWVVTSGIISIAWLKVDDGQVEWYLWKKVKLLNCSIEDITHIGAGRVSAYIIKNRKGTIRLLGMHMGNRNVLSDYLMEKNPNIQYL